MYVSKLKFFKIQFYILDTISNTQLGAMFLNFHDTFPEASFIPKVKQRTSSDLSVTATYRDQH